MKKMIKTGAIILACFTLLFILFLLPGCLEQKEKPPFYTSEYVVFAWNDLGMHCLNPSYDKAVILPPYNNLIAQVVKRGDPPRIVTDSVTVHYSIINNSSSYNKRQYGGFWDNISSLFEMSSLEHDKGLTGNSLSGIMKTVDGRFLADGIPVTPVDDGGVWDPYQVAEVTVRNLLGKIVAVTRATVPTSDEINCAKCHGADAFNDILSKHDANESTTLMGMKPVLCAKCHGTMALGKAGRGPAGKYLSEAIHGYHATKGTSCYDCHPGQTTRCNRSERHTSDDGNCTTCHGTMTEIASSTLTGRVPWVNEPACIKCHTDVSEIGSAELLYRETRGHGNMMCSACHGSPHAMVPSLKESDNYQALQYQPYSDTPKSIASCGTCHDNSRGEEEEMSEFTEKHGGHNPEIINGCFICHTTVYANTSRWPHAYTWKNSVEAAE